MNKAAIAARIIFGAVFIAAGAPKILDPAGFSAIVYNYYILPEPLVNIVALWLPWLETLCGVALIMNKGRRAASLMMTGLMAVFMATLAYNIYRGLDITCGCFSTTPKEGGTDLVTALIRDAGILLLGLFVTWRAFTPPCEITGRPDQAR